MFRLKYFILGLSIICVGFNVLLYAQEETKLYASKEDCIKKFDIDNINFLDPFFIEKTKLSKNLLREYFNCKAALNNNVNECNRLNPDPHTAQQCREHFNARLGFFAKLLLSRGSQQPVTRDILNVCVSKMDFDIKTCKQYMEAFIKQDTSVCKNPPFVKNKSDCEAFISMDEKLSRDEETKDRILYLKAMKDLAVEECRKIQEMPWRRECEAYVTGDKKICEQCDDFKKFREVYCTEFSQTR